MALTPPPNIPGDAPPSDGNPRLLTAWAFDNAWKQANNKANQSAYWFTNAVDADGGPASMNPASFNFTPNAIPPSVYIPYMAEGASIAKFEELSTAVINQLSGLYEGYLLEHMPNQCGYLESAQQWICNTLTNGGTGINPHVEAQIWERERARVLKEGAKAEKEVIATWAARGYPLPPGAAAYQVLQIKKDTTDKIAESSRAVAIKQAEIEIENVRLAVSEAIKLYGVAIAAAGDYLKAMSIGPSAGMQVVPSVTDSQSKLIGAVTDYWRANISFEELRMKASLTPAEWDQQSRIRNGDWLNDMVKVRVNAAIAAAQNVGTQAAAALNSLHGSTGVTNSTSDSVSYSYSNDTDGEAPTITQVV